MNTTIVPYDNVEKKAQNEAALNDMLSNNTLTELDISIDVNDSTLKKIAAQLSERLGKSLFTINTDKIPISENWSVYVVEDTLVFMVPLIQGKKALYITEKTIVKAFTDFFTVFEKGFLLKEPKMAPGDGG